MDSSDQIRRGSTVIVQGSIGAGKSSFVHALVAELDGALELQEPDEQSGNPYLADFYREPARFAFVMQVHLLQKRYRQHMLAQAHCMSTGKPAVMDRSFYGDTCFAHVQADDGTLTANEYATYRELFHIMSSTVLLPSVVIFLDVTPEVAAERVRRRLADRDTRRCEEAIDLDYLRRLDRQERELVAELERTGVKTLRIPWDEDIAVGSQQYVEKVRDVARNVRELPADRLFFGRAHGRQI